VDNKTVMHNYLCVFYRKHGEGITGPQLGIICIISGFRNIENGAIISQLSISALPMVQREFHWFIQRSRLKSSFHTSN
jgi:hypothetical protein